MRDGPAWSAVFVFIVRFAESLGRTTTLAHDNGLGCAELGVRSAAALQTAPSPAERLDQRDAREHPLIQRLQPSALGLQARALRVDDFEHDDEAGFVARRSELFCVLSARDGRRLQLVLLLQDAEPG